MKNVEAVRAWGVYIHDKYNRRMAAVFPYFSAKRQQREKIVKCAEVRTKKISNTIYALGKCTKMQTKKEFLYTICAGAKNLDFPGKIGLVDTITRTLGNHQKSTEMDTKKRRIKPNEKRGIMTRYMRGSIPSFPTP